MSQKMPPNYIMGLLHSIEKMIVSIYKEFPRLADNDVEWVVEKLANYYKVRSRGKKIEEPSSPSEKRQALLEEILNVIDDREEIEADLSYINNPDIRQGEYMFTSLEQFYVLAFKKFKALFAIGEKKEGGLVT